MSETFQAGYYKSGKLHLGVIYFSNPAYYVWCQVASSKSAAISAANKELARRMTTVYSADDIVMYQSPFMDNPVAVQFRGRDSWGNAILFNQESGVQFSTPQENVIGKAH